MSSSVYFYCAVQLDGGGQRDADGNDLDNIEGPKEFPNKTGSSIPVIDQMNKESSKKEMEGVAGLEKLSVKDGTQVIYAFQFL